VRRGGKIVPVPPAWRSRQMDFGRGPVTVTTIPWGDVATAWHSTGIPDIEVYTRTNRAMRTGLRLSRWLGPLLRTGAAQRMLKQRIRSRISGPDEGARERGWSVVIGEVRDAEGNVARARLTGPEGYTMTARTAVEATRRVLDGGATPGFRTPSLAFGPDFVLTIEGVMREDR